MMITDGDSAAIPLWRLPNRLQAKALVVSRADANRRTMEEYRRQLYVAMTRARDELYVCGYTVNQQKPECWYELVRQGMMTHSRVETRVDAAAETNGALLAIDLELPADRRVPGGQHIHPLQEERFEVVEGTMRFRMGGSGSSPGPARLLSSPPARSTTSRTSVTTRRSSASRCGPR